MRRDLSNLADTLFDVLVVGGGITGACAASDAAERGLTVALVDKNDFGAATSANSLKVLHGGLRYLQHFDFRRMRESIGERRAMAARVPHLVRPVPFLVPTHGLLLQSRAAMAMALAMNDLVGIDRNRDLPQSLQLPRGRTISPRECREYFPYVSQREITGGAIWYDYQAIDTERITLDFVLNAARLGAVVANYVSVEEFLDDGSRVCGVRARDVLGNESFDIKSRIVVNATGPWIREVAGIGGGGDEYPTQALAINLVSRSPQVPMGLGVRSVWGKDRDPVCGGHRFMFMVPWKESTLLGTSYRVHRNSAGAATVNEETLLSVVEEFNESVPGLGLSLDDITFYHWGLVPLKAAHEGGRRDALAERSRLIDHMVEEGRDGLISLSTVKYTTARQLAQRGIDLVCAKLGIRVPRRRAYGSSSVDRYSEQIDIAERPMGDGENLSPESRQRLMDVYGKAWTGVAGGNDGSPALRQPLTSDVSVLGCEVQHAVTNEMALNLSDVVFRRTGLGSESCPPGGALLSAASIMGDLLGWTPQRRSEEVDRVVSSYRPLPIANSPAALSNAAGAWAEQEK